MCHSVLIFAFFAIPIAVITYDRAIKHKDCDCQEIF